MCTMRPMTEDELISALRNEKEIRIKYQDIVYSICNILDMTTKCDCTIDVAVSKVKMLRDTRIAKDALIKELVDALEVSNQFIIASDNIELSEVTKESVIERADQALAHAKEQSNESTG